MKTLEEEIRKALNTLKTTDCKPMHFDDCEACPVGTICGNPIATLEWVLGKIKERKKP